VGRVSKLTMTSLFDQLPNHVLVPAEAQLQNYRIEPQTYLKQSLRKKVDSAIAAIQTLRQIDKNPSPEQAKQLVHYLGSGILADLFVEPVKPEWAAAATQLKAVLTDEEYKQVRGTVTTAYYTPPEIVSAMYWAGSHMGIRGGTFLDPTIGSGLFLGLSPQDWDCQWTGVEIDPISGHIAQALYPQANVYIQALERTRLPLSHFDAAWGNVPYSEITPYDPQFSQWRLDGLHNYCIARSVQATRPGGVVGLLTSVGTLQSKRSQEFREKLSDSVRLLGAFKMPMGTFKRFSHTDAPADLLFFQVLGDGETGNAEEWVNLVDSPIVNTETGNPLMLNQYFAEHPEYMLGELTTDKLYASPRLALKATHPDLASALKVAMQGLPQDCYQPLVKVEVTQSTTCVPIPPELQASVKPFAYIWHEDEPWQCRGGMLEQVAVKGMQRRRLWKLITLRDAVRETIQVQWESDDDTQLAMAQKKLTRLYNEFIVHYGWVHGLGNAMAFGDDPEYPLVLSIENYDPDAPESTTKADIFTKRTIRHIAPVESVETAAEALVQSLVERGGIDLEYMQWLYKKPAEAIIVELQSEAAPLIFHDPATKEWVTADEYLSGNVRQKHKDADAAAQIAPNYLINLAALKEVQPKDLDAGKIYVRLGSPWVPTTVIERFICNLLNIKNKAFDPTIRAEVKVYHNVRSASWDINYNGAVDETLNGSKYGTARVSAIRLIELALNQQLPEVFDRIDRDTTRKNREETHKALLKQEQIKEQFKRWVWEDWQQAIALVEIYNRDFNCFRERKFNGAHLKNNLPGVSTVWLDKVSAPERAYQLNTIWRMIVDGNTLAQHPTGSGKTATAVIASQEMRRHHLCSKPALVVPDHLVLQQTGEAVQVYPGLRVLPISTRELDSAKKRQELTARIATGVWDLIVMSQTALKMMPLSPETIGQIVSGETEQVRESFDRSGKTGKRAMKQKEKAVDRKEEQIRENVDGVRRDNTVYFDRTGINYLLIDESQNYLGLATDTQMRGVLGVAGSESQKAQDLYYKCQYLRAIHGDGRGINLLTATPIQNTLGQSWVNLKYLCPQTLEARGIQAFDAFIATFAEATFTAEKTAAGTIEPKMRLNRWSNRPEFRSLWLTVSDVVLERDLNIRKPKPIYGSTEVPATPNQLKFFDYVAQRAKGLKDGTIDRKDDSILRITTHVKLGVIDLRLLTTATLREFLSDAEIAHLPFERSKLVEMAEQVYEAWEGYQEERYTQLVFLDLGTPNTDGRFSAYQWAKQFWIARGVPEKEIAFIHGANTDNQKAEMFQKFRNGIIRILMGSTAKMGAGTQIPNRLKHLWDVDCPLRPTDFWQRHGRILRPGNMHAEVFINSLITVGRPYQTAEGQIQGLSPDSYLYEVNLRKATFIQEGLYSEDETLRTMEDIDEAALDFGLLVATAAGDRRFIEKVNVDNQVTKLLMEESSWRGTQVTVQSKLHNLPAFIEKVKDRKAGYEADLQQRVPTNGKHFSIDLLIEGKAQTLTQRTPVGYVLQELADKLAEQKVSAETRIGSFAGFELWAKQIGDLQTQLVVRGNHDYISIVRDTPKGTMKALENVLGEIDDRIDECHQAVEKMQSEIETLTPLKDQPFDKAGELAIALGNQLALNQELGLSKADQIAELAAA